MHIQLNKFKMIHKTLLQPAHGFQLHPHSARATHEDDDARSEASEAKSARSEATSVQSVVLRKNIAEEDPKEVRGFQYCFVLFSQGVEHGGTPFIVSGAKGCARWIWLFGTAHAS